MNERQFYETLRAWRSRPYQWETANCCHFGADIARCWGLDISIPECQTPDEAAAWIEAQGAKSLYHYLVSLFGRPQAPLQGKRGWLVYRKGQGLEGSAIGTIERRALFVSRRGLVEIPLGQCAGAFDPGKYRG